ncbi:MAG: hypothetical protein BGO11_03440 [Solirubrobacterales bacterium 70-9]|nr:MAG: hypothetical protein BGO11_03440 [Solirubrobacterales bacterium 70-9]
MRKPLHLGALGALIAACGTLLAASPASAAAYWHPRPTTAAWQWELQGKFELTPGASVYEIDGFEYPSSDVKAIHRSGAKAICYLDVGSWEEYRPDASQFPRSSLGAVYEGYPEERWLDIAHYKKFAPIMEKRIAMCAHKGFDAVEPDNVNGWENKSGFRLTAAQQLRYNRWIASQVHQRGMAVALKNDSRQVRQLVGNFDFAVVEECFQYEECDRFKPFVAAGKAVFEAEYELPTSKFCPQAQALDFAAIRKDVELFPQPWEPCAPPPATTG